MRHLTMPDIVESVGEGRGVVHLAGQPDGPFAALDGLGMSFGEHGELGLVAVRHGEEPVVSGVLQHGDRLRPGPLRGLPVAAPPLDARQPSQAGAQSQGIAEPAPHLHRFHLGGERGLVVLVEVALERVPVEELHLFGDSVRGPVIQRQPQVRGGFPV